jgi:MraZ protein
VEAFTGSFNHKIDAKGRLSLPSEFRKILESAELKVTPDPKKECLMVFANEGFTQWVDSLFESRGGYSPSNSLMFRQRTMLNSLAKSAEIDGSGRILLNAAQREAVGLDREVVIVGNEDHFQIWDADRWNGFFSDDLLASLME